MSFVTDWVQEKAAGLLRTGIQAGGTLAGNAVGGVGNLIESSGRAIGEGSVNGSIRNVGNGINSYGEGIKASMAADGPVHAAPTKKTPVTAGTASAAAKRTTAPQKALPSAGGNAPKALPAPAAKPASGAAKAPAAVQKSPAAAKPPADGKVRVNPASRPVRSGAAAKPTGTGARPKPNSNAATNPAKRPVGTATSDGKVRISAESRPKAVVRK